MAMDDEYESLTDNKTWKIVRHPKNCNIMSPKWIYKKKEEQMESFTVGFWYKARMMARGSSQIVGRDHSVAFAPVAKFTSIRIVLSIMVEKSILLHQVDVITAFINGDLHEDVYMEQPHGYERGDSSEMVCKLLKALYGLNQAPRQWYAKIDSF